MVRILLRAACRRTFNAFAWPLLVAGVMGIVIALN
jgi:hypothetical protein